MDRVPAQEFVLLFRKDSTQRRVFVLLSDEEWHCRECEGKEIASGQYAGGGGIQGLQRGNGARPGIEIESERRSCATCRKRTTHDRWTGLTKTATHAASIPPALAERILSEYNLVDAIEQRKRQRHELVIDHRFPMERWGASEPPHDRFMSGAAIRIKFQLLKKDAAGNHNLLKSRACERCIATGQRGLPLGIRFWYQGGPEWPAGVPPTGPEAERGCHGCGWYDFDQWRAALNAHMNAQSDSR